MKIRSVNPSTGKIIREFDSSTPQGVTRAVERARVGQGKWVKLTKSQRIKILRNLQKIIQREKQAIVDLVFEEAGMPKVETEGVIVDDILVGFDAHIKDYQAVKVLDYSDEVVEARVEFVPQGIVGHIGIWNYPFWQTMISVIPALLTGNAVVFKPSEYVTMTGLKIDEIVHEAGVPQDVFITLTGGEKVGEALVKADVDMIVFTGGIDTGLEIIKNAKVKPLLLELSGNDAAIVCSDCDVKQAVKGVVWGAFLHGGQVCTRIKRIFVIKEIADEFIRKMVEETKQLRIGKEIAPLIREEAREKVHHQVQEVVKSGAQLLIGGEKVKGAGFFYQPTVLFYEDSETPMFGEEIFGPVSLIQKVKDEEEAIRLANEATYGLGGSVWTKDFKKAKQIVAQLETGMVWINDSNLPIPGGVYWGGIKSSGIASSQSRVMAFLKKKTIVANRRVEVRDWWFPY